MMAGDSAADGASNAGVDGFTAQGRQPRCKRALDVILQVHGC